MWFESNFGRKTQGDPALLALHVKQNVHAALMDLGVTEDRITSEAADADGAGAGPVMWEAPLPPDISLEKANLAVTKAAEGADGRVVDGREWRGRPGRRRFLTLAVAADSAVCLELLLYETEGTEKTDEKEARLAVVLVEAGRDLDSATRRLIESPLPLAVAVLPARPASEETARLARDNGKEVLLHLPMEPAGFPRRDPGSGAVLLDHSEDEIRGLIRLHLEKLGHVSGVVNYMGSAFMRDRDLMRAALLEVKARGLYFMESPSSIESVLPETAGKLGVPWFRADLFLESSGKGSKALAGRLDRAERVALQRGEATVLSAPTEELLELLTSRAAGYEERGIVMVKPSDLMGDR